jgi:hypothetical protein
MRLFGVAGLRQEYSKLPTNRVQEATPPALQVKTERLIATIPPGELVVDWLIVFILHAATWPSFLREFAQALALCLSGAPSYFVGPNGRKGRNVEI